MPDDANIRGRLRSSLDPCTDAKYLGRMIIGGGHAAISFESFFQPRILIQGPAVKFIGASA
jgi:hypothetical protein